MLCGCSIVNNPGLATVQNLVRHVGSGRGHWQLQQVRNSLGSRISTSISHDDLADDNFETRSLAASSSHMTSISHVSSRPSVTVPISKLSSHQYLKRSDNKKIPKESSSSSEELPSEFGISKSHSCIPSSESPITITKRHHVTENQDMAELILPEEDTNANLTLSASVGQLEQSEKMPTSMTTSASVGGLRISQLGSRPSSIAEDLDESCSASETGSLTSLDKKSRKRRSFFLFKRKKEKKDVM